MRPSFVRRHIRAFAVVAAALAAGSLFVVPRTSFAAASSAAATFRFVNVQNGLCIEKSGNTFILNTCNGGSAQRYSLDVPDQAGVPIRHVETGDVCLAQAVDGSIRLPDVVVGSCNVAFPRQRWSLIFVGGGYRIQNMLSGDFLDGSNNLLRVRPQQANNNQKWQMVNN